MRFCPVCHERYDDAVRFCVRDGSELPMDEAEARLGTTVLGQFELLEVVGKGAMGTVYRAWQAGMERQVAVKILHPELMRDPKVVARFDREARAVAKLTHPNIVTSFVVGETLDGLPFLAMEYVEGESLDEALAAAGPMEPARALRIALQITSALSEAHAEGIVHRDLKPANILLTHRRRMPDFVKILDFGIAKILRGDVESRESIESRLTREGAIFGTPHYIAPEQASGSETDHRADLYSLGCILFRMLTGKVPFDGAGMTVLLAHIGQPPPSARSLVPSLDPQLDALLGKLLAKDPADRYQSAEELADALERAGGGRTRLGSSSEATAGEASPPHLAAAPVDEPVGASLLEVDVGSAPASRDSSLPAAQVSELPVVPRRRGGWLVAGGLAAVGAAAAAVMFFQQRGDATPPAEPSAAPVAEAPPREPPAPEPPGRDPTPPAPAAPPEDLRTVTVGEGGYAIRAQVPRNPRVDETYVLTFDVLDPSGAPLAAPTLSASVELPSDKEESFLAAAAAGTAGRYTVERRFVEAGHHHVHVFPSPAEPEMHIWFDIPVADANGKIPEHRPAPKKKPRSTLAARPSAPPPPPAEPEPPPPAQPPAETSLVEDEPPKALPPAEPPQVEPAPARPPPRAQRPRRPRVTPRPNPDGLE
jgi:serine/threonine protein kinase